MPNDYNRYLYHFTTVEKAMLYILPSLELKLAPFLNTNDPKENKTFGFGSIYDNCDPFRITEIKKAFKLFLDVYCKLICFSTDYIISDNRTEYYTCGVDHPTMWTHYSNGYKGICIVIDQNNFKTDNLQNNFEWFEDVNYNPCLKFPSINQNDWEIGKDEYFRQFLNENKNDLFYRKHIHWQHENEKRYVHIGNKDYCSISNSIEGIIVGNNFDNKLIHLIKKFLPANRWIEKVIIDDGRIKSIPIEMINDNN